MRAKDMDVEDAVMPALIVEQVRVALVCLTARGMVRKVVLAPDVWWNVARDGVQVAAGGVAVNVFSTFWW